jgi:hypothetical protein
MAKPLAFFWLSRSVRAEKSLTAMPSRARGLLGRSQCQVHLIRWGCHELEGDDVDRCKIGGWPTIDGIQRRKRNLVTCAGQRGVTEDIIAPLEATLPTGCIGDAQSQGFRE